MAKGYRTANVDLRNADGYKQYVAVPDILRKFGGRYVAMARYRSPGSAKAITLRQVNADANRSVIEGYERSQP